MPEEVSGSDFVLEEETTTTLPEEASEELPEETESQEEIIDVSGNDISGTSVDGLTSVLEADSLQVEALVEVCSEMNQNIVTGFVSVSILLGVLIGIVFVKGFSTFIRGV